MIADVARGVVREELDKRVPMPELLTTRAAATVAGVAQGTIRRWIREGRLVGHRAGRVVRVQRSELDRLLNGPPSPDAELTPEQRARRDFG